MQWVWPPPNAISPCASCNEQVERATGQLSGTGETSDAWRGKAEGLAREVESLSAARDRLTSEAGHQATTVATLESRVATLEGELAKARAAAEQRTQSTTALWGEVARLRRELAAARETEADPLANARAAVYEAVLAELGTSADRQVVGRQLVLQADSLFVAGTATLTSAGRRQLGAVARAVRALSADLPSDRPWQLAVEAHTASRDAPGPFASRRELAAARAAGVADLLAAQGIAPDRLAATGFGEYRPVDPAGDEIAARRNRRIALELKGG